MPAVAGGAAVRGALPVALWPAAGEVAVAAIDAANHNARHPDCRFAHVARLSCIVKTRTGVLSREFRR
jgi:hypothetical protein